MNTGIIGLGFVGNAIYQSFLQKGINVIGYDKYKSGGIGTFEDILHTDIVFLCLPTLYNSLTNEYDKTSINDVCKLLETNKYDGLVILKSTVEPTTTKNLANTYKLRLIHNPEFLTAKTALNDFNNQYHVVLGITKNITFDNLNLIRNLYINNYNIDKLSICTSNESESMKLFSNSFYAMKIQIFNEFYLLSQKLDMDYDHITQMMIFNNWINPMHTTVPGTDGLLSYGGACFPKDTNALLAFMKKHNTSHQVLEACIKERNEMRE